MNYLQKSRRSDPEDSRAKDHSKPSTYSGGFGKIIAIQLESRMGKSKVELLRSVFLKLSRGERDFAMIKIEIYLTLHSPMMISVILPGLGYSQLSVVHRLSRELMIPITMLKNGPAWGELHKNN